MSQKSAVHRRSKLTLVIVVATVLILAVAMAWAFQTTWIGPLLRHHVMEKSGRQMRFDDVHVGLSSHFEPTVRFRGLWIENARWASVDTPLIRADEVTFVFAWPHGSDDRISINRLVLIGAEVDLEFRADGLRNWRLTRPDDRGPGRIRVVSLDARRTHVRFTQGESGLEVDSHLSDGASPTAGANVSGPLLTKRLDLVARRSGMTIDARFDVSDVLNFYENGTRFALRGQAAAGSAIVALDGTASSIVGHESVDVSARVAASDLSDLQAFFMGAPLPSTRAVSATAQVERSGSTWTIARLKTSIGHSDVAGDITIGDARTEHPARAPDHSGAVATAASLLIKASLRSERIDLADFRPRTATVARPVSKPAVATLPAAMSTGTPSFDASRLRRVDGEIEWQAASVAGDEWSRTIGALSDIRIKARIDGGVLRVAPLEFSVAGGHVKGSLRIAGAEHDDAHARVAVSTELDLAGIDVAKLSRSPAGEPRIAGAVKAHVALSAEGASLETLLASLTGRASASLTGASISESLGARLALDGGALIRSKLGGDGREPVTCSALSLAVDRGIATIDHLAFETARATIDGSGAFDLGRRSIDMTLMPHRKTTALLSLDRAIRVTGPLRQPTVSLTDAVEGSSSRPGCGAAPAPASGEIRQPTSGKALAQNVPIVTRSPLNSRPGPTP